ncbi:MAG: NTE family protein [Saprospiraceae bacterium]|jgi:NTE family protein|tara:strand:+ start:86 stop:856 length:771 start_codon:yes stop_codon:yes gene_type:complete
MKLGLCLSGGGARGIAHIGVLKAFEEYNIFPQYTSGTSAGSIVGALYAAGIPTSKMIDLVKNANLFKIFRMGSFSGGFVKLSYLQDILRAELPATEFKDLPSDFFVCVSNINKGKWTILKDGNIAEAVVASCSIPLVFEPVKINGELYVDGGLLNNFPVEPLVVECEMIIGVNVMPNSIKRDISGLRSVAERCFDLVVWNNSETRISQCDVLIEIEGVDDYGIFDFLKADEIIELGYQEAVKMMPEIIERIQELKI